MEIITYEQIRNACDGHYPMSLVGREAQVVARVLKVGIDSRLEACWCPERGDRYEWKERRLPPSETFPEGAVLAVALDCQVSPESLPVLLRRLIDDVPWSEEEGSDSDEAELLASDILDTLGIENMTGCFEIRNEEFEVADATGGMA